MRNVDWLGGSTAAAYLQPKYLYMYCIRKPALAGKVAKCVIGFLHRSQSLVGASSRNVVERFFNKVNQCGRVATRYDKLAANYLAFIQLASIRLWLRVNESTS